MTKLTAYTYNLRNIHTASEMNTYPISARITLEQKKKLDVYLSANKLTISDFVRISIDLIEKPEKLKALPKKTFGLVENKSTSQNCVGGLNIYVSSVSKLCFYVSAKNGNKDCYEFKKYSDECWIAAIADSIKNKVQVTYQLLEIWEQKLSIDLNAPDTWNTPEILETACGLIKEKLLTYQLTQIDKLIIKDAVIEFTANPRKSTMVLFEKLREITPRI